MKIQKLSIVIGGHKTSISLEPEFYEAIKDVARRRDMTVSALVAEIDADRGEATNLSSHIRLHVLADLQRRAALAGDRADV
ncbi:putative DNA-binding ribbon-helix-helix protein [Ancylobacter sp. 3268]|uniref:ribbon-helix-helix domain-containing protein n=1 Tax=Ancylobacter sp. 3268 TaxID=2817752 RepID=UPI002863463F|nr:ribbon-helix-helix domain-containing protein [Ancylobacter sp. 3268]MDR6954196.1 putative DNA-binding ribbon-helix-helix protein [Ancylobacter sp. 3268]